MVTKKLVLGTANFGNSYGIASTTRSAPMLDKMAARNLYELALKLGITNFDTANNYGPSIQWLSEFSKQDDVKINSKVSIQGKSIKVINEEIHSQIKLFESNDFSCLSLMQVHNWSGTQEELETLQGIRDKIFCNHLIDLGATTYGYEAALSALKEFDDVQIEWNILNQRSYLTIAKRLKELSSKKKNISVRSILLQGLLTLDLDQVPIKFKSLIPVIANLHQLIDDAGISRLEFIIRSFHSLEFAESLVIGVDNEFQLREIHEHFQKGPLRNDLTESISKLGSNELELIDPRNW